jgi:indole-3-glycerol phosphate synthase
MATRAAPILERIVQARRREFARFKVDGRGAALPALIQAAPPPLDFRGAITGRGVALIAECKQRSPSGGVLQDPYDPVGLARRYAENGAAALSILTEPEFFGGSFDHLLAVRAAVTIPILCKDFVVDSAQVFAARAVGADAVLLIAGILDDGELNHLQDQARSLGMQAIVEVHTEEDVERALLSSASMIGINNRDLMRMKTDKGTTARLRPLIPAARTVISESGIESRADVEELGRLGVDAVLVGESLLRAPRLEAKVRELSGS